MRSARKTSSSNMYLVAVRSASDRVLFVGNEERALFLGLVRESFAGQVEVLAWCLARSCAQFVLWADLPVRSRQLQNVLSSYARWFNKRHRMSGRLYRDRFFSTPIETDDQLLSAVRSVHLFAQVEGEMVAARFGWSSYREYLGTPDICNTVPVLGAVGGRTAFRKLHRAQHAAMPDHLPVVRVRVSDEEALRLVVGEFGSSPPLRIALLPKPERNDGLRALKAAGLSARQITQFTGVGRGVIEKL
ncbi:MAG: hypothetical protein IJ131_08365 [Eggerthellaceae bacterium]|nr:hypothetical protein [Eggerthellaceae bacterium]